MDSERRRAPHNKSQQLRLRAVRLLLAAGKANAGMSYCLTRSVFGEQPQIELSGAEYKRIRQGQLGVLGVLGIEELLEILLGNYVDLERTLLDITLQNSVFARHGYREFHRDRYEVERRILNLLAAVRTYLDHMPQRINELPQDTACAAEVFHDACAAQYDASLNYRAMEALRNFIQHRDLAISVLGFISWVDDHPQAPRARSTLTPYLSVERLGTDKRFKASVLQDLRDIGEDSLELKPMIREYVDGLVTVHLKLRAALESSQEKWIRITSDAIERYKEGVAANVLGLCVVELDENEDVADSTPLFGEAREQLIWLQRKNRQPFTLLKRSVTSETRDE